MPIHHEEVLLACLDIQFGAFVVVGQTRVRLTGCLGDQQIEIRERGIEIHDDVVVGSCSEDIAHFRAGPEIALAGVRAHPVVIELGITIDLAPTNDAVEEFTRLQLFALSSPVAT